MGTLDWEAMIGKGQEAAVRTRTVRTPIEHQGVRNALRGAFRCPDDTPEDFSSILARIR